MVKRIDSQALDILTKSLGLTGAGSPLTELTDGVVDQMLSINEMVRRSRTQGVTGGIYSGIMRNIHTDAETLNSTLDPYDVGTTIAIPPYPPVMPPQFDVWLLGAALLRASGGGTIAAALRVTHDPAQVGWRVDDGGAAFAGTGNFVVAFWDSLIDASGIFGIMPGTAAPFAFIRMRLPRSPNTRLTFSSVSSLTSTYDLQVLLGVFPVALGQDGLV